MKNKTIDERAKLYAGVNTLCKFSDDYYEKLTERKRECKAYIKGATEQERITRKKMVNKACEWLVENGFFGCKDSIGATSFRDAMLENK